jgi:phosphoribosylformimino-5-aminoimidazole carboxamide ribotide isomerase
VQNLTPVQVYAAIDLLQGRCVRLRQGDFATPTVYSEDPVAVASWLADLGAGALHVIDLDGARTGRPLQTQLIGEIARETALPVQAGGGLRTPDDIEALLAAGVFRVLTGTAALCEEGWIEAAIRRFGPESIAVAVDVEGEDIRVSGWESALGAPLEEVLGRLAAAGVRSLLVTDVSRDGMLEGPNLPLYRNLSDHPFRILASGGVRDLADLRALSATGVEGVVVGRSLYEGKLGGGGLRQLSGCS